MCPSPIMPRPSSTSAGSGVRKSHTWKLAIRSPARAICRHTSGSHQTWNVSTTTPTCSAGNASATSSACPSVDSTARSAQYIGCSGSSARRTPRSPAYGASSASASATRCRAPARSREPGGRPPTTSTRQAARSAAASSIARRLSARAAARPAASAAVRNPPRHSDDTRSPASVTSRAAAGTPISATGSRHSPIAGMPARTQPSTASATDQRRVVRWLSDSFASGASALIRARPRRPGTRASAAPPVPGHRAARRRRPAGTPRPGAGRRARRAGRRPW